MSSRSWQHGDLIGTDKPKFIHDIVIYDRTGTTIIRVKEKVSTDLVSSQYACLSFFIIIVFVFAEFNTIFGTNIPSITFSGFADIFSKSQDAPIS